MENKSIHICPGCGRTDGFHELWCPTLAGNLKTNISENCPQCGAAIGRGEPHVPGCINGPSTIVIRPKQDQ